MGLEGAVDNRLHSSGLAFVDPSLEDDDVLGRMRVSLQVYRCRWVGQHMAQIREKTEIADLIFVTEMRTRN